MSESVVTDAPACLSGEANPGVRLTATGDGLGVPSMMVALLLYAYARGNRSSRGIERACFADVAYRVVAGNLVPDHSTIADFRCRHEGALGEVFSGVLSDWSGSMLVSTGRSGVFGAKASLVSQTISQTPRASAWHALVIARDAGKLTTSTFLLNLATPSQIADTSWIKPGISAWDVWHSLPGSACAAEPVGRRRPRRLPTASALSSPACTYPFS